MGAGELDQGGMSFGIFYRNPILCDVFLEHSPSHQYSAIKELMQQELLPD